MLGYVWESVGLSGSLGSNIGCVERVITLVDLAMARELEYIQDRVTGLKPSSLADAYWDSMAKVLMYMSCGIADEGKEEGW